MGRAKECPPGAWMADAAGKEATFSSASCLLQTLPYNGDKSKSKQLGSKILVITCIFASLFFLHCCFWEKGATVKQTHRDNIPPHTHTCEFSVQPFKKSINLLLTKINLMAMNRK